MNVRGQDRHKISGRPIILHGRFVRYGTEGKIPVFQLLPGRCAVQVKADIGKRQAAGFRAFGNIQNAVWFHQQLAMNRQYAVVEPSPPCWVPVISSVTSGLSVRPEKETVQLPASVTVCSLT